MFKKLSGFGKRIFIGKTLGLLFGLLGFCITPLVWPEIGLMTRWGILLWYMTFGTIIGVFGVMGHHPIWKNWEFSPYFRGILIGGWLNLVLVFFAYEPMQIMLNHLKCPYMHSPFWFVLEGAILGLIIDLVATKYGGQGEKIF